MGAGIGATNNKAPQGDGPLGSLRRYSHSKGTIGAYFATHRGSQGNVGILERIDSVALDENGQHIATTAESGGAGGAEAPPSQEVSSPSSSASAGNEAKEGNALQRLRPNFLRGTLPKDGLGSPEGGAGGEVGFVKADRERSGSASGRLLLQNLFSRKAKEVETRVRRPYEALFEALEDGEVGQRLAKKTQTLEGQASLLAAYDEEALLRDPASLSRSVTPSWELNSCD